MRLGKQGRTAEQLRAMVQVRIDGLAEVRRRDLEGLPLPVVGLPSPLVHDPIGRTWDVPTPDHCAGLVAHFRAIVDALREAYDLA